MALKVTLMIDSITHVKLLDEFWTRKCLDAGAEKGKETPSKCCVCIDVDMSYRPIGTLIHLGVHRSPVRLDALA